MSGRRVYGRILLVALAAMLVTIPYLAEPELPFKSTLKKRVSQFYAAYINHNWPALYELIAPFVRRCESVEDFRRGWTKDSDLTILSWRLVSITSDSEFVGQDFKVDCSGKTYRVEAGASVVTSQLDQQGQEKPERGDAHFTWVLIDGVWFAMGPE